MILKETKITSEDKVITGYFLTLETLQKLVRDFQVDCFDGFVSNDLSYIEHWLKNHTNK